MDTTTLTETQKQKLDKKLNNYLQRLANKKRNNTAYYEKRKESAITCECCQKTMDSFYYNDKHIHTHMHKKKASQIST